MTTKAAIWNRDTPWRQGHILSSDAMQALGISNPEAPETTCAVVISHDCDLANDNLEIEPNVEIIIGRFRKNGDGNFFWAKSTRTLHMVVIQDSVASVIELMATAKTEIPKNSLASFSPDTSYAYPSNEVSALRTWLSARYNRAAFPDAFVDRLQDSKLKTDKKLASIIKPVGELLSAVYFDVDKGEEIDHSDGSAYELSIVLVFPPGDDPEQTIAHVEKLEQAVEALFSQIYFDEATEQWKSIALIACMSISEDEITVGKAKLLTEWRLDYMTLKAEEGDQ